MYYDRQGKPISLAEWGSILESDQRFTLRRVAETSFEDGRWLSTVWLGLDHGWIPGGRPPIFETMLFKDHTLKGGELGCWRYSAEQEALEGHARIVARLEAGLLPEEE